MRVTKRAPIAKAPCTIEPTFCLKLSSEDYAVVEPIVPKTESDPNPHNIKPSEAIHKSWEKMRTMHPRKVVQLPMISEILLPLLSAKMAMKKQPIMVPRYGALE
jgi:hypothetical protein